MDLKGLMQGVNKLSQKAGEAILDIYENVSDFGVESKSDDSPITIADKRSNEIICIGLNKINPDIPIISEENRQIPFEERRDFEYFWLIDPLDGTKEFIKRNGDFTVNIALIHQHRPVLSAVYLPCTRELYFASKDKGAFLDKGGKKVRLETTEFRLTDKGLRVLCSRSHLSSATLEYISKLNAPQKISRGSALKFLLIARGEAELYPRMDAIMEWDTAAAQLILEEAGGEVIDQETGEALKYNKKQMRNSNFIASGKIIYS